MTENTTKVVSARLPLGSYLQIAAAAGEKKMTVADFVLLKLFAHPDPSAEALQQATKQVNQLTTQVTTLTAERTELGQAVQNWQKHANSLQQTQQATATQLKQATHQLEQLRQELAQQQAQASTLAQQLQTAQAQQLTAQKRLQDLRQALANEHNNSNSRNQMPEQYWDIVEQFVPKKR